jgi:hypothetical protein
MIPPYEHISIIYISIISHISSEGFVYFLNPPKFISGILVN